jgi:hypothetical protein
MSRFLLPHEANESVPFVPIVNFLVSYEVMSLGQAADLNRQFKLGNDVVIEIPDSINLVFMDELDYLNCAFEVQAAHS